MAFSKIPWASLALLVVAYSTFGWVLSNYEFPIVAGLAAAVLSLLIAIFLTAPLIRIGFVVRWLRSLAGSFVSVVIGAFCTVLILFWLHVFAYILVLISAEALARLDMQIAGYTESESFWLLSITSLISLTLGWLTNTFL